MLHLHVFVCMCRESGGEELKRVWEQMQVGGRSGALRVHAFVRGLAKRVGRRRR